MHVRMHDSSCVIVHVNMSDGDLNNDGDLNGGKRVGAEGWNWGRRCPCPWAIRGRCDNGLLPGCPREERMGQARDSRPAACRQAWDATLPQRWSSAGAMLCPRLDGTRPAGCRGLGPFFPPLGSRPLPQRPLLTPGKGRRRLQLQPSLQPAPCPERCRVDLREDFIQTSSLPTWLPAGEIDACLAYQQYNQYGGTRLHELAGGRSTSE